MRKKNCVWISVKVSDNCILSTEETHEHVSPLHIDYLVGVVFLRFERLEFNE
jgi:hypothetical protein